VICVCCICVRVEGGGVAFWTTISIELHKARLTYARYLQARFKSSKFEAPREYEVDELQEDLGSLASEPLRYPPPLSIDPPVLESQEDITNSLSLSSFPNLAAPVHI